MVRLLLIFSLLIVAALFAPAIAENVTEVNNTPVNATKNESLTNVTIQVNESNLNASETNKSQQTLNLNKTIQSKTNETEVSLEELVKLLQSQLEELKKQNEILREENKKLREQIANLTKRLEELERRPVTWEDVAEKVDEYYIQFVYWTGWLWPMLTFYLIYRYRKPALETEEEKIQEAAEKLVKEKQREWYSFQIRRRGIEAFAEDETELAIFRALGIHTVADILDRNEQEIVEAFKAKYQPTADIEEHFRNRLREIKERLKEVDGNA